jgi:hypothetical protein
LIDVIVTNENLHAAFLSKSGWKGRGVKNHRRCPGVYQKPLCKSTGAEGSEGLGGG